jgi:opacity protein-like surface antigen
MQSRFARTTVILFLFVISFSTSRAQVSYGAKAGLNLSRLKFTNSDYETSFKTGFHLGGFVNYGFNDKLFIEGELFYSAEGGKEEYTPTGVDGTISMGMLQLPVLARLRLSEGFFAEAGPQFGFLLSIKEEYAGSKSDISEYYKKFHVGAAVGLGYRLQAVDGLSLSGRYSFGLSPVNNTSVAGGALKSRVISLGVLYELGRK